MANVEQPTHCDFCGREETDRAVAAAKVAHEDGRLDRRAYALLLSTPPN